MNYPISIFNKDIFQGKIKIDSIPGQITLIEDPLSESFAEYPVKLDVVISIICLSGSLKGSLNLKSFTADAPCLFIVLPGQILQIEKLSEDFRGRALILSKEFWDGFPFDRNLEFPLFRSIRENPWVPMKKEDIDSMTGFFHMLQRAIRKEENQNRAEAVKYLVLAFFYGFGYQYHQLPEEIHRSKKDKFAGRFLVLVRDNYRNHRTLDFYAEKLSLSPKHLSKILKQHTGKSGAEWIEDHVILEAKALLKSTEKTIQQISDELNFPSQSFFGKYFKRRTGISPKSYRKT